jgi:hypothetical protein
MKSGFTGLVGLELSLFAAILRIRRRIGRHKTNIRKLVKPIFSVFPNRLYNRFQIMFTAAEPASHPEGGADKNLYTCKQTTWNV